MSSKYTDVYQSKQKCEWCGRQSDRIEQGKDCQHKICDRCIIKKSNCQSNCPLCWNKNIENFIRTNEICSVCCSGLNSGDESFQCPKKHLCCSECTSEGCIVCQFGELKAWNQKKFDDLPANFKHVFYACEVWQNKSEEDTSASVQYKNKTLSSTKSGNEFPDKFEPQEKNSKKNVVSGDCIVCIEPLGSKYTTLDKCGHSFHQSCIDQWYESSGKQTCPTCGYVYGFSKGPQPDNGRMDLKYLPTPLPGFESSKYGYKEKPTIEITYTFPSGKQGPLNPSPGQPFTGTSRRAYLPNNKEGKEILALLQKAFDDRHIFTIGRSSTTGEDNVVTWNDVHHKTSITGGPDRFGYPDPTYLFRVRQELADKGYK